MIDSCIISAGQSDTNNSTSGQKSSIVVDEISLNFRYGFPADLANKTITGSGYVSATCPVLNIFTGANDPSSAKVESKAFLTYYPGRETFAAFSVKFPTFYSGASQWIGLFDDGDGFAIGYNGTDFSILLRNNSIDTIITQDNFSNDKLKGSGLSGISIDPSKYNVFRISFGCFETNPIKFDIMGQNGTFFTFHIIAHPTLYSDPITKNLALPLAAEVKKSGHCGRNDVGISTGSWQVGVSGRPDIQIVRQNFAGREDFNITQGDDYTPVLSIRNKTNFHNVTNRTLAKLIFGNFFCDSSKFTRFKLIKNGTLTRSNFVDVSTNFSAMEYDISSASIQNGREVFKFTIDGSCSQIINFLSNGIKINILPGETLTLIAACNNNISGNSGAGHSSCSSDDINRINLSLRGTNTVKTDVVLYWEEEF